MVQAQNCLINGRPVHSIVSPGSSSAENVSSGGGVVMRVGILALGLKHGLVRDVQANTES